MSPKNLLLTLVALVALMIRIFFVGYYNIPQNGMYPTLPPGSKILTIKKPWLTLSSIKRGDIVVFVKEINGRRYNFVWRVVGLPGETINVLGNDVRVNGKLLKKEFSRDVNGTNLYHESIDDVSYDIAFKESSAYLDREISVTIPPEHFFVMGDHRNTSEDSKKYGPVSFSSIIGKVIYQVPGKRN